MRKMKKMRKTLALVLCLVMCLSMLPTWALAEDDTSLEEPAVEMVQEEVEAELQKQATEPEVPAEEPPVYEESAPEEAAVEVLPEPAEEVWPEETTDAAESAVAEELEVPTAEGNDSSEAESAPENTESTEQATEPDIQNPAEPTEETDTTPVVVMFVVTPEEAELLVYTKDEYDEKIIIDPEENGSYLLLPGEYFYTLTAEGYVCVEEEKLQVEPSEEPIEIELTLASAEVSGKRESTEEVILQATEETEETATLMTASGTCGDNLTWTVDDEGVLTISGSGDMYDYNNTGPWGSEITKIVIREGVLSVGSSAFDSCFSVNEIELPNSLIRIGKYAFDCCNKVTTLTIPENVTTIEEYAFSNLWKLESISLPASVICLGNSAFNNCYGLSELKLSENLETIPRRAFAETAIKTVIIPHRIKTIGEGAFYNVKSLEKIFFYGDAPDIDLRAFEGVSTKAYYSRNKNWSDEQLMDYGGSLSWEVIEFEENGIIASGTCGDNLTWTLDDEGTLTISGTGAMEDYQNHDSGMHPVSPFYSFRSKIINVIVEPGVTSIGSYAFSGCSIIKNITLPESIVTIGRSSFQECSGLTGVSIPESVTSIDYYVFYNCSGLVSISIPENVNNIHESIFYGCSNLTDVYYGGSRIHWLGIYSASSNDPLKNTMIHYGNDTMSGSCGENLFWTLNDDGYMIISGQGEMLSFSSMYGTPWVAFRSQIKNITIKEGVTSIGSNAFEKCDKLTGITIAESVTSIGTYAFSNCSSLVSVVIPEGITRISMNTFAGCTALGSVTLPISLTSVVYGAFNNCSNLQDVYYAAPVSRRNYLERTSGSGNETLFNATWHYTELADGWDYCGINALWKYDSTSRTLTIKGEGDLWSFSKDSWSNDPAPWADYASLAVKIVIEEGITNLPTASFPKFTKIREMNLPSTIASIGNRAFSGCSSLEKVIFPEGLRSIGNSAFSDCSSLSQIALPSGLTSLGDNAFYNCIKITSITIPAITEWGDSPLSGCSGLKTAGPVGGGYDLEYSWTTDIPNNAFNGCSGLTRLVLPGTMETIGNYAFAYCYDLEEISLPSPVRVIGEYAFCACNQLRNIYFIGSLPDIRSNSFSGVTATAYYPDNGTWWEEDLIDYGGKLTWVAIDSSSVHYDLMGGAGDIPDQQKEYGVALTLSTVIPTKTGCDFLGWAETADATEAAYQPGALFTKEGAITLYAVWDQMLEINAGNFPDVNFRNYVQSSFDQNNDGILDRDEIAEIKIVSCNQQNIRSLKGIEYFPSLERLICFGNALTELDVSNNPELISLNCGTISETNKILGNNLSSLDVSKNLKLQYLWCAYNQIRELDVSRNTELLEFACYHNQLKNLDVSKNVKLQRLLPGDNPIGTIDVSNNPELWQLNCYGNGLKTLDISNNLQLTFLWCNDNSLRTLDLTKHTALQNLNCIGNQLTSLDLSNNADLQRLECYGNALTKLDLRSCSTLADVVRNGVRRELSNTAVLYFINNGSCYVSFDQSVSIQPTIFSDNGNPDAYFHDAVYWAVDNGITSGKTATTFAPYDSCTRAQVMSFLYKAKGSPEVSGSNPFTDVKESDYFYKPVLWAVSQGITSGTSATTFSPYNPCTRAQVMSFLYKAMGSPEVSGSNPFTDVKESDYFYKPVLWAVSRGITNGTSATTFGPYNTCTRAQVMTFLYKAMN